MTEFIRMGLSPLRGATGTKLGPWLFILMINDLRISSPLLWKYVNNIASEVIPKGGVSNAQDIADCVFRWSEENRVQLNSNKM